jgi:predicted nucleic acid-binding Zn ribbon protein
MPKDKSSSLGKALDKILHPRRTSPGPEKQEELLQLKLKQQVKTNILILISVFILTIVIGMALAFLK